MSAVVKYVVCLLSAASIVRSTSNVHSANTTASVDSPCRVSEYSAIASATASCTNIVLDSISVPTGASLNLSKLLNGTVLTFAGTTTFAFWNTSADQITIGGTDIQVTAEDNAVLDGNGLSYWDGLGSDGGVAKPFHFIGFRSMLGNSLVENLYIQNYPSHGFYVTASPGLVVQNITINNTAGLVPNARSAGKPAAANADGFDVDHQSNLTIKDSRVYTNSDCVGIFSGDQLTFSNLYCENTHGLSIGSLGGRSNNNVTNVLFEKSTLVNNQNGCRIKMNYNETGFVSNITYQDIVLSNISAYGIDVQEDYKSSGPTGIPTSGFTVSNILFSNVTGTAQSNATDYYILCGCASCTNITFQNLDITGSSKSSCNAPIGGSSAALCTVNQNTSCAASNSSSGISTSSSALMSMMTSTAAVATRSGGCRVGLLGGARSIPSFLVSLHLALVLVANS